MTWTVETLDGRVDSELLSLPADMQARFLRISELIEAVGLADVGMPHVRKLQDKIREMRLSGRAGVARALYTTISGQRVVILHVTVKKRQETPRRALELAKRRAQAAGLI